MNKRDKQMLRALAAQSAGPSYQQESFRDWYRRMRKPYVAGQERPSMRNDANLRSSRVFASQVPEASDAERPELRDAEPTVENTSSLYRWASRNPELVSDVQRNTLIGWRNKIDDMAAGRFASGGYVDGPGGPREDMIPAMLSDGEYVLPADTVEMVGEGKLDALRKATHKFPTDSMRTLIQKSNLQKTQDNLEGKAVSLRRGSLLRMLADGGRSRSSRPAPYYDPSDPTARPTIGAFTKIEGYDGAGNALRRAFLTFTGGVSPDELSEEEVQRRRRMMRAVRQRTAQRDVLRRLPAPKRTGLSYSYGDGNVRGRDRARNLLEEADRMAGYADGGMIEEEDLMAGYADGGMIEEEEGLPENFTEGGPELTADPDLYQDLKEYGVERFANFMADLDVPEASGREAPEPTPIPAGFRDASYVSMPLFESQEPGATRRAQSSPRSIEASPVADEFAASPLRTYRTTDPVRGSLETEILYEGGRGAPDDPMRFSAQGTPMTPEEIEETQIYEQQGMPGLVALREQRRAGQADTTRARGDAMAQVLQGEAQRLEALAAAQPDREEFEALREDKRAQYNNMIAELARRDGTRLDKFIKRMPYDNNALQDKVVPHMMRGEDPESALATGVLELALGERLGRFDIRQGVDAQGNPTIRAGEMPTLFGLLPNRRAFEFQYADGTIEQVPLSFLRNKLEEIGIKATADDLYNLVDNMMASNNGSQESASVT